MQAEVHRCTQREAYEQYSLGLRRWSTICTRTGSFLLNQQLTLSGDRGERISILSGDKTQAYKEVCKNMVEITIEQCSEYRNIQSNA